MSADIFQLLKTWLTAAICTCRSLDQSDARKGAIVFRAVVLRLTFLIFTVLLLTRCAIIKKVNRDGTKENTFAIFSPLLRVDGTSGGVQSIRMAGLGIAVSSAAYQFGIFRIVETYADADCKIIIFPASDVHLKNFADFVRNTPNICVYGSQTIENTRHTR